MPLHLGSSTNSNVILFSPENSSRNQSKHGLKWCKLRVWAGFCPVAAHSTLLLISVCVNSFVLPGRLVGHLTLAMKTIRTHCLCLCHTWLHGLSSDGTVQPCAIKQLFPVHQLRLVTLDENIFAWFPWLQRGEKWLPSQPSGSPFIHRHIIYFCRFLEGPSCTEWKCKMCWFTWIWALCYCIPSRVTVTTRDVNIVFAHFFWSWFFIIITLKAQNKLVLDIKFHFLYRWLISTAYERHPEVCKDQKYWVTLEDLTVLESGCCYTGHSTILPPSPASISHLSHWDQPSSTGITS